MTGTNVKRYYLAGPMSWVPQFNIPLFDEAARQLRARDWVIVSPAELDNEAVRAACLESTDGAPSLKTGNGETWGDFLARDVKLISDQVDGIIFLPDWQKSRGARLEAFVGLLCSKEFFIWIPDANPAPLMPHHLRNMMQGCMP